MTITPALDERLRAALDPDDYRTLAAEVRHLRVAVKTAARRADQNHDTITRLKNDGEEDRRLAQIGRAVALRFSNPSLTYSEEQEARQTLIRAHLGDSA